MSSLSRPPVLASQPRQKAQGLFSILTALRLGGRSRVASSSDSSFDTQKALQTCWQIEQRHHQLGTAADLKWHLTTAELAAILTCSPRQLMDKTSIKGYGFVIECCGQEGGQPLWRVKRGLQSDRPPC